MICRKISLANVKYLLMILNYNYSAANSSDILQNYIKSLQRWSARWQLYFIVVSRTGAKRKRREAETVGCCATALTLYCVFTDGQDNPVTTGIIIIIVTIHNELTAQRPHGLIRPKPSPQRSHQGPEVPANLFRLTQRPIPRPATKMVNQYKTRSLPLRHTTVAQTHPSQATTRQ